MSRIALVMIARDEARCIERGLCSAAGVVDEIWVLDTGSVDDTPAIARRCGAQVAHWAWRDDFAAARNAALDLTVCDWRLVLDADEWIGSAAASLSAWRQDPAARIGLLRVTSLIDGGAAGAQQSPSWLPRLLPRGVQYAVELRNRALLTPAYGAALADVGAVHCHNAWTFMPSVLVQARQLPPQTRRPLVLRWLLRKNDRFSEASERYAPFNRIVAEDPETRAEVASLVGKALRHDVPALVLLDNKAEGCAPESVRLLARALSGAATA